MDLLRFYTVRKISMREIEKAAEKWAKNEKVHHWNNTYSTYSKRKFIYDAVSWLKMLGCQEVKPKTPFAFKDYRDKYLDYMAQEQGLAQETVYGRAWLLRNF